MGLKRIERSSTGIDSRLSSAISPSQGSPGPAAPENDRQVGSGFQQFPGKFIAGDRQRGRGVYHRSHRPRDDPRRGWRWRKGLPKGSLLAAANISLTTMSKRGRLPTPPPAGRPRAGRACGADASQRRSQCSEATPRRDRSAAAFDVVAFRSTHHFGSGESGKGHRSFPLVSLNIVMRECWRVAHRIGLDGAVGDLRKLINGDLAAGLVENALVMAQNIRLAGVRVDRRADRRPQYSPAGLFIPSIALSIACAHSMTPSVVGRSAPTRNGYPRKGPGVPSGGSGREAAPDPSPSHRPSTPPAGTDGPMDE